MTTKAKPTEATLIKRTKYVRPPDALPVDAQDLAIQMDWVYKETSRYLDTLARNAREGKSVVEASNFCRWLQFSGVLTVLGKCSFPGTTYAADLNKKKEDILWDCGQHFKAGKAHAKYASSDIAEINRKLDALMGNSQAVASESNAGTYDEPMLKIV